MKLPVASEPRSGHINSAAEIADFLYPTATNILLDVDEVAPMLLLVRKDALDFIGIAPFFASDTMKDLLGHFIRELCENEDVEGVGLVTEGWLVIRTDPNVSTRPSEEPDRMEVLMIYGEWRDCSNKDVMVTFTRAPNGKAILGDRKDVEDGTSMGRLRGFFIPENRVVN